MTIETQTPVPVDPEKPAQHIKGGEVPEQGYVIVPDVLEGVDQRALKEAGLGEMIGSLTVNNGLAIALMKRGRGDRQRYAMVNMQNMDERLDFEPGGSITLGQSESGQGGAAVLGLDEEKRLYVRPTGPRETVVFSGTVRLDDPHIKSGRVPFDSPLVSEHPRSAYLS